MPVLLTACAGAGKTAVVIEEIVRRKAENPWQPVWVLLPTELQINVFRERLMAAHRQYHEGQVIFGVEYFSFYPLYSRLLDRMLLSQRQIEPGSVYRILRHIIDQLNRQGDLIYFQPIAQKPGFIKLVADFILELKQARLSPDDFSQYAREHGTIKDLDLAKIYDEYQTWVRERGVVDREGAGWLALEMLRRDGDWLQDVGLLAVDGFQQFSPLQMGLVEVLANGVQETILTLTYEEQRASGVHRPFTRTLERLQALDVNWQTIPLVAAKNPDKHPVLHALEQHFLVPEVPSVSSNEVVQFIEAPDAEQEVRGILRQVKAMLLDGYAPDQIIILAHDLQRYADLLRSVANAYGVPLVFRRGIQLTQNPAVIAILKLLDLHTPEVDFGRQAVLDVLRSPYFVFPDLSPADVDTLEWISLQYRVIYSRDDWMEAIQKARQPYPDEEGETPEIPGELEDLDARLDDFFELVTPPEAGTLHDFIDWLETLLGIDPGDEEVLPDDGGGELQFYGNLRWTDDSLDETARHASQIVVVRDLHAMHGLRSCWHDLLNGYDLLNQGDEAIDRATFRKELQLAVEQHFAEPVGGTYRQGRVLVTSTAEGRGLAHDHVLMLGVAEGVFPMLRQEDALYSDRERRDFNATQPTGLLQTVAERQNDTAIFYECMAIARQTLTLSRPTLDENANPWPPSILWQSVKAIVDDIPLTHYRAGEAPPLDKAATLREASIALADALQNSVQHDTSMLTTVYDWLHRHEKHGKCWQAVVRGRTVELGRSQSLDSYAGVLCDPDLIDRVANTLGPGRVWSATQFNDYGYCPFRFFSKRLLKLEALEEPEEGFDARQLGTLQHQILEETYTQIKTEQLAIRPENMPRALEIMNTTAQKVFKQAPHELGFRVPLLWEQEQDEIRQRLRRLIALDFSDDPESPFVEKPRSRKEQHVAKIASSGDERTVYELEAGFGEAGQPVVSVPGAAGALLARGSIDRIDRVGDTLIVMDYKSGTKTPSNDDVERGRNFQMMLYLIAAQQLIEEPGVQVGAGMFWSLRTRKIEGEIRADDATLEAARERLHEYILAGREGYFPLEPRKLEDAKCFKYCEFNQLCRMRNTHAYENMLGDDSEAAE